jgi:hypothetical protein
MNIIEALDDPALFGGMFPVETWGRWRVFLAALFGLPVSAGDLEVFQHHTARQTPPADAVREAALVCGRRGGKSRILAVVAIFLAAFRDYSAFVAPGEQPTVAIIAADRRQARVILKYVVGLLRAVAMLEPLIEDELTESVTLTNGVVIGIFTGAIGSPRGWTFVAVLCDEIAFWRSEDSANPDAEVVAAVRPGLASIPGSILLMASSPYAKRGVLWSTFRTHYGREGARVLVWRGKTLEMNPRLDPIIIDAAREDDPASAASEYDAEFRSDIAAFVAREVIEACTPAGRFELPPRSGVRYVAFVDPSGGSADSMTLAVAHQEAKVATLDAVREVRPPFSPESVTRDFAALLKTYSITTVRGDRYAGEWPRERFREHGIGYELSDRPKSEIYRDCLPIFNAGRAEILDLPRLANQLIGLERRTTRGGRDSIDHAAGGHDDIANAAAGALLLASAAAPAPARYMRMNFMAR